MTEAKYIAGNDFGTAAVLKLETEMLSAPTEKQVTIRQFAIGVNFIDVLQRKGELGLDKPFRLGIEAAGEVVAVGKEVTDFLPGDRIVYAGGSPGGYADIRNIDSARAIRLPDWLDYESAAAVFFKALTADYLVYRLRTIKPGDSVLFWGAAGGVGSLAIPLLKSVGACVIGGVGRAAKVKAAHDFGCDHVVTLGQGDIVDQVMEVTDGKGVSVAYDPIGKATFDQSLASLARFGLLVSFGWASGEVKPIPLARLREQGSVFLTRPTVSHYTDDRHDLEEAAKRVFNALKQGVYRPVTSNCMVLEQVDEAHRLLESGGNVGSVILVPQVKC